MSRLDKWKDEQRRLTLLTGENQELADAIHSLQPKDESRPTTNTFELINIAKELIYSNEDGKRAIHFVCFSFNIDRGEMEVCHILNQFLEEDYEEDILSTLAIAVGHEVPVYPNTRDCEDELAELHRKMIEGGFKIQGERYRLASRQSDEFKSAKKLISSIDPEKHYSPSDISIIRQTIKEELSNLESADRLLFSLQMAIDEFTVLLESGKRNENSIQTHLSNNPILFGFEYKRVIPKHRLGGEYETDYALEKYDGSCDVVELESSNLKLYTKAGNPTSHLVHAEQQLLDWLDWIDKNNSYARTFLNGLYSPSGFVVIGRREGLSELDKGRLRRRNIFFNGKIKILTYEDLLERGRDMYMRLKGNRT
ncbi:MAG: DUF4263 domain-containing protein [candidate division Zixibacteria bacterium]|nr:DUF4263 domain-containing protein [candidate division Zixibacteria bacterium]